MELNQRPNLCPLSQARTERRENAALTPLIIDRRGPVTAGGERLPSLLGLPLGRHTLLEHLGLALAEVTREKLVVLPSFQVDSAYKKLMADARATVILPEDLESWVRAKEPADTILIMDAGQLPASDFDFLATVDRMGRYRGVTHVVAVGSNTEDTHEQLESTARAEYGASSVTSAWSTCRRWPTPPCS